MVFQELRPGGEAQIQAQMKRRGLRPSPGLTFLKTMQLLDYLIFVHASVTKIKYVEVKNLQKHWNV